MVIKKNVLIILNIWIKIFNPNTVSFSPNKLSPLKTKKSGRYSRPASLIIRGGPLNFKGTGHELRGPATLLCQILSEFFPYKYHLKSGIFPHLLHENFRSKISLNILQNPLIIRLLILNSSDSIPSHPSSFKVQKKNTPSTNKAQEVL